MNDLLSSMVVLAYEAGAPAPAAPVQSQQSPWTGIWGLLPFVLILIAFFWFTSRAQKKRDQKRMEMLDSIKVRDDVLTVGGIHGRVMQVKDNQFVLRVDDEKDVKITVARDGISRKVGEPEPQ